VALGRKGGKGKGIPLEPRKENKNCATGAKARWKNKLVVFGALAVGAGAVIERPRQ